MPMISDILNKYNSLKRKKLIYISISIILILNILIMFVLGFIYFSKNTIEKAIKTGKYTEAINIAQRSNLENYQKSLTMNVIKQKFEELKYNDAITIAKQSGNEGYFYKLMEDKSIVLIIDEYQIQTERYEAYINAMTTYYENFKKIKLSNEIETKIKEEAYNNFLEEAIVSKMASKFSIKLSEAEIDESFDKLIDSNGGRKSFGEVLDKYYSIGINDFKRIYYEPKLLKESVSNYFVSNASVNNEAKKKAEEITAKAKADSDFGKLAQQYSEDDGSKNLGGDLGYFAKGKMIPEFENVAFSLKVGEISEPVKTVYGYHIIKVIDIKNDEIRASHILIKTPDFNSYLDTEKDNLTLYKNPKYF